MPVLGRAFRKGLQIVGTTSPRLALTTGLTTVAGVRVSPESATTSVAVYAATSLIAQTIAVLPVRFVLRGDDTRTPQQPPSVQALWDRPNADQSRVSFYESLMLSLLLWGNFYGYLRRNNRGDVVEVWPIDPERVSLVERIKLPDGRLGLSFDVFDFRKVVNVPGQPPEMLHIPALTLPGRIEGMSPIKQAMEAVGLGLSAEQHAARFLGDGTHMSGLIEVPEGLDEDDAKELWENFQRMNAGPSKAGRTGILTAGAKYHSVAIPPVELQFLEQMKYSDSKIATLYRVPPHMVSDVEKSTSWGTGIEEQTKGFAVYTLTPWLAKIEHAVDSALLAGTDYRMKFDVKGLLRGSPKDRAEFYRVLWNMGVLNANTILGFEDMPPIGADGDRYYVPLNVGAPGAAPEGGV